MKTLLAIFLFAIEVCYAQLIPHIVSITSSKDSVLADEAFTVTYSLKCPAGYIYIGLNEGYFESIGKDRWEGEIKDDETKTVTFTVKLKESAKAGIQKKVPLSIGFSYTPFGEKISAETSEGIIIIVTDFKEMKDKINKVIKGNMNKVNNINNINIYPTNTNKLPLNKRLIIDTTIPRQEYLRSVVNDDFQISKVYSSPIESEYEKIKSDKPIVEMNELLPTTYILQFYASNISFRNEKNQKLPWQYYTVQIWGLQSTDDQYPVTIVQQTIENSTTGGFTISTTADYPYYQLVFLLESSIYIALSPPDSWNGVADMYPFSFGLFYETVPKPIQDTQYNVPDPDVAGNTELYKVLNICDSVKQGFKFVKDKSGDIPSSTLILFNENITAQTIPTSFSTSASLGGTNYPVLYIRNEDWNKAKTILHEYGHVIQSSFGTVPPEAGGSHILGIRYNPQLAYSEG
ncbi:MAG: hypothetical protein ABIJ23_03465 [Candidatus Magasanikbacteria bacterium]|nr:hypothetical protein [Bacteroidota bacterium]MBU1680577.1 hypothetical protein [Bacteroidota bacterium]